MDAFDINPPFEQNIADTIESNFMPYAMSVIVSRALPEIDGFKPSHRKILYTMYMMRLLTGNRTKSANVVGQTMKLNPHGDQAIYETIVRLTKGNEALLHPFIDSKGNFGKQYSKDMRYAAARYTEIKLATMCEEIFKDIEKDTVDFVDNYDGTMLEPVLLPTTFPNVLVNTNQGIAVAMASNICSFNLEEVCRATMQYITDPGIKFSEYIKGPDFSTGGEFLYNRESLETIYETGRGSFRVRARYRYDKENNCIEIFELPYTTTVEAIIDQIATAVKGGRIKEINDIRDETDINGLKLAIEIRKSTDPDALMKKLFKMTYLEDSFSCNFNILINGSPRVMGIKEIIDEWLDFRTSCIARSAKYDIDKKSARLHLLEGLAKVLLDIDKAVEIIRKTTKDREVVPNLMKGFMIDEIQAEFIAEIKLRNLNKEYILKMVGEIDILRNDIKDLTELRSSQGKIRALIKKQLAEVIKKYGQKRKTLIIHYNEEDEEDSEMFVEDYNLRIYLTEQGYFKKIPLVSLRTSPQQKIKDDDCVLQEEDTRNKADVLLFSDKCTTYKVRLSELQDCKPGSLGEYLPNLLGMEPDESIVFMTSTVDYKGKLIFFYENGKAAKIDLGAYATKTNRKKLANGYSNASRLVKTYRMDEDEELVAISSIMKVLIFNTKAITEKVTRNSQGIQIMTSKNGSYLKDVKKLGEVIIAKPGYYRKKSLPAIGTFLRGKDNVSGTEQMSLEIE